MECVSAHVFVFHVSATIHTFLLQRFLVFGTWRCGHPPISSGSGEQNKSTHWTGDYTGEAEP